MKRRFLIAYDGSELSEKMVKEVKLQAAAVSEAEIYLLAVVGNYDVMTNYPAIARDIEGELAEKLQKDLNEIKADLDRVDNASVYAEVFIDHTHRNAGRAIVEYASDKDINLILIGSHGLGGFKGTILGSVSNQVVQHAECKVLLIK